VTRAAVSGAGLGRLNATVRALTEEELRRLLDVARRRPILDAMMIRRGKRKGQTVARLREETRRYLETLGRERALIYKALVLTGLRKGELASLTVGQLDLDAEPPYLVLVAADEKNREGSTVALRADLAADLREWIAEKSRAFPEGNAGQVIPFGREAAGATCGLPADAPIFTVPRGLARILDRDLRLAGIPKRDKRGRTVDVHALRHTFGTLLSKGGVFPRTAQAAMRHSSIDLTMNTYTDPKLLDVAGAVEALPNLPLGDGSQPGENVLSATGTDDSSASQSAPKFAPTLAQRGQTWSFLDRIDGNKGGTTGDGSAGGNVLPGKDLRPLPVADNGRPKERETGLEPATSSLGS